MDPMTANNTTTTAYPTMEATTSTIGGGDTAVVVESFQPSESTPVDDAPLVSSVEGHYAEDNGNLDMWQTQQQQQQQLLIDGEGEGEGDTYNPRRHIHNAPSRFKRGHTCCGRCCDVRRAVIIVDLIRTAILVWGFLVVLGAKYMADLMSAGITDGMEEEAAIEALKELETAPVAKVALYTLLQIFLSSAGIVGALHYNILLVAIASLSLGVELVTTLYKFDVVAIVTTVLFLYPHVVFIKEVRDGIMSKENYPNERHSCCCV